MYNETSRYKHADTIRRSTDNVLFYSLRPRLAYMGGYDEIMHKVVAGDTLHNLAARYYASFASAANLWWFIADFQPEPLNDPTVQLIPGTWLAIPSVDLVQHWLMSTTDEEAGAM